MKVDFLKKQIRTCRIAAYGSYLRYLASKRTFGCVWLLIGRLAQDYFGGVTLLVKEVG